MGRDGREKTEETSYLRAPEIRFRTPGMDATGRNFLGTYS